MRSSTRTILIVALTLGALALWITKREGAPSGTSIEPESPNPAVSRAAEQLASLPAPVSENVPVETNSPRTVRDVLEDFYGDAWPAAAAALEAKGKSLDEAVEWMPPWEEVESDIRRQATTLEEGKKAIMREILLGWDGSISPQTINSELRVRVTMSDELKHGLEEIVTPLTLEMRDRADTYFATLEVVLDALWENGEYQRAPFNMSSDYGADAPPPLHFETGGTDGWCAVVEVPKGRFPVLDTLLEEIHERDERRHRLAIEYARAYRESLGR